MLDLKAHVRTIPDYPKPGILFYDIGTLLGHGGAWKEAINQLAAIATPLKPDKIIGIESRGFLVGASLAANMGIGFAMVRKKGKLPGKTLSHSYTLEYGQDTIEMQDGILSKGDKVILCDDLLATGGTAAAALTLARSMEVEILHALFLIELDFLNGRKKIDVPATSLLHYSE